MTAPTRLTTTDPYLWFGRPGSLLRLPYPQGGIQRTRTRVTDEYEAAGGQMTVTRLPSGRRRISLGWDSIDYGTFAKIEEFDTGAAGRGPWAVLDPALINMLSLNQSAATSSTNDTSNFGVATTAESIASSSALYLRGPRSLAWTFLATTPAATPELTLSSPWSGWYGIPVQAGQAYVFSAQIRGGGTDAVTTVTPRVRWLTAAGATVSDTDGSGVASSSGAWAGLTATATAPPTAAYASLSLRATPASVTNGGIVYVDTLQFERGATVTTWVPGTGVNPVEIISLTDTARHIAPMYRTGVTLILQEVRT